MKKYDISNIKFSTGDGYRPVKKSNLPIGKNKKENKIQITEFKGKELIAI